MIKNMIENVKQKRHEKKRKKKLKTILGDPRSRLAAMRAGYKRFSSELTERERAKMKKQIKQMEREVRNWEKNHAG